MLIEANHEVESRKLRMTNPYLELMKTPGGRTPQNIERATAWSEAVVLAFEERVGREMEHGESYSAEDAQRASEIVRLFPLAGA
jgi:hypothetical protein